MAPAWWQGDLEAMFADAFNDGPLTVSGLSTSCIMRQGDQEHGGLGLRDLSDMVIECHYPTAALAVVPPTIGSIVTVGGATFPGSYFVRHKQDQEGGTTCLYLALRP